MALRVDDVDLVRDRALVERFQLGDPAAFETLYLRYFARLVRYCHKRVGDPHEAEEIAQEAFTRALRAMPTFAGERRFYPWLTVIAGRLCVDAHRRNGRSEPSAHIDLGVIDGGQEHIVDAVDVEILATALGRLADRHREVLDLREQQGRSYQDIADHYGVTLGTVEALLFRARKALKREFLAVVGDERHWAALPVIGLVGRRLAAWKARLAVASPLPSLAAPVVAGFLAVAAISGFIAVADGSGSRSARPTSSSPTERMVSDVSPAVALSVRPTAGVGDASTIPGHDRSLDRLDGRTPAFGPDDATRAPDRPPSPLGAPRFDTPVVDSVGTAGADAPQPIEGEIAGVFVGLDPAKVMTDSVAHVEQYRTDHQPGVLP